MARFWLVVGVSLVCATSARAADWSAALDSAAVASYLDGDRPRVLVVSAGTEADSRPAAAALRRAIARSGRAKLVMDDSALGDLRALADDAIVKRAAALPVDEIVVARIFGDAPTLVATLYNRDGKTQAALSVDATAKLAPRTDAIGTGVTRGAVAALDGVLRDKETSPAERSYTSQHLGFHRLTYIGIYRGGGAVLGEGWGGPYRGSESLSGAQFYETVGRSDYARDYQRRGRLRTGLGVTGGLLLLTGVILTPVGALGWIDSTLSSPTRGHTTTNAVLIGAGAGSIALGIGLMIPAFVIHRAPVALLENHRLAAEYNRRLREKLGLPADRVDEDVAADVQSQAPTAALRMNLVPTASTQGAGVMLRAEF